MEKKMSFDQTELKRVDFGNIEKNLIEIELTTPVHFRIIKETLSRMGIGNSKTKKLCRSCHIIEKDRKYYILHFKELFLLDTLVSK